MIKNNDAVFSFVHQLMRWNGEGQARNFAEEATHSDRWLFHLALWRRNSRCLFENHPSCTHRWRKERWEWRVKRFITSSEEAIRVNRRLRLVVLLQHSASQHHLKQDRCTVWQTQIEKNLCFIDWSTCTSPRGILTRVTSPVRQYQVYERIYLTIV